MMNIAEIFDSLQENYPLELTLYYEQLTDNAWLFMTDCDYDNYSCFIHLKDRFIWKVTGNYEQIRKLYNARLRRLKTRHNVIPKNKEVNNG